MRFALLRQSRGFGVQLGVQHHPASVRVLFYFGSDGFGVSTCATINELTVIRRLVPLLVLKACVVSTFASSGHVTSLHIGREQ